MSFSHRPSGLKQSNKKFKTKHASKSTLKDRSKGRTAEERLKQSNKSHSVRSAAHDKAAARRNKAKQIREAKNESISEASRLFTRKGSDRVARVVAVLPLTSDVHSQDVVDSFVARQPTEDTHEGRVRLFSATPFHNQLVQFVSLPPASEQKSLYDTLDACVAADFVVLAFSAETEVNYAAETLLRSLIALGVGSTPGSVVAGVWGSTETSVKASLLSYVTHFVPGVERMFSLSVSGEARLALRHVCEKTPRRIRWRDARGRISADGVEYDGGNGVLAVRGTIRGAGFDVNRLVHLCGEGDFRLREIRVAKRGGAASHGRGNGMNVDGESEERLVRHDDEADDLQSTNVPEDLLNEQTWPTEEEMAEGDHRRAALVGDRIPDALPGTTPNLRRVPKGTSAYQAAWLEDEEEEEEEEEDLEEEEEDLEEEEEEENDGFIDLDELDIPDESEDEEEEVIDLNERGGGGGGGAYTDGTVDEYGNEEYKEYLKDKRAREDEDEDDAAFPDEVDTPVDRPVRERFARYRGLQSFRTSRWDPYENLPEDYARCFMFSDFAHAGKRLERIHQAEGAAVEGARVVLYLEGVSQDVFERIQKRSLPLLIYSLFMHEHKKSVMHLAVTRNTEYTAPVRSKDEVIAQVGFRRFVINPVFSQHTLQNNGKGVNNVHKMEKYLRHSIKSHIASAYLPVTFGSGGVLLFKRVKPSSDSFSPENDDDDDDDTRNSTSAGTKLVATGSVFTADPTRIIAKRIMLTGSVFKVHRRTATIRYMFFNDVDVAYYKPIQLRTKRGRVGNIKESLGTHGYYKAIFDGPIDQMDVVCMCLYKRCFPRWGRYLTGGGEEEEEAVDAMEVE